MTSIRNQRVFKEDLDTGPPKVVQRGWLRPGQSLGSILPGFVEINGFHELSKGFLARGFGDSKISLQINSKKVLLGLGDAHKALF